MECLDVSAESPPLNLALDEALLLEAEEGIRGESLRFWVPATTFVVLGYSRRMEAEVDLGACAADGIPVLRRASGGGTVLQLPGSLNFSLVLDATRRAAAATVAGTTREVMETHARVCSQLVGEEIGWEGESDLTWRGRKFSGNAQRRLANHVLFHGTFLLGAEIPAIIRYLRHPEREPAYRRLRSHGEFLVNLPIERETLQERIMKEWGGTPSVDPAPLERARALVRDRYDVSEWLRRR